MTRAHTLSLVDLSAPPAVVGIGRGLHGVSSDVDVWVLPELWSLHLYPYAADLEVDGTPHAITPGSVSLVPPATRIRYRYRGPSRHVYAHLRAPLLGPRPDAPAVMTSPGTQLPAVVDLLESAVTSALRCPERTQADVWTALLRLRDGEREREPTGPGSSPASDHVAAAMSVIEARLPERLTVTEVARAVGVSPDHLTRVFSAQTGQPVVGWIRRRRVEHAQRLLTTTTMSVAAVAATVGIPDLQAFNKTCRAVTGRSPRQLRASAP